VGVLAILDMTRERMHAGLEKIEKLRKIHPEARVVVVTEDDQDSIRTQVKTAGARGLIRKPLKREEVLKVLADALKG
jgi:DNA-binding NarL/FixJ family response regulator